MTNRNAWLLRAHRWLWEDGKSRGLPGRGDACNRAEQNGLAGMTRLGSLDSGRGGERKVQRRRARKVLFGGTDFFSYGLIKAVST